MRPSSVLWEGPKHPPDVAQIAKGLFALHGLFRTTRRVVKARKTRPWYWNLMHRGWHHSVPICTDIDSRGWGAMIVTRFKRLEVPVPTPILSRRLQVSPHVAP